VFAHQDHVVLIFLRCRCCLCITAPLLRCGPPAVYVGKALQSFRPNPDVFDSKCSVSVRTVTTSKSRECGVMSTPTVLSQQGIEVESSKGTAPG
jgi:hypothetical protein